MIIPSEYVLHLVGGFFILFGVTFLAGIMAMMRWLNRKRERCTASVEGVVTRFVTESTDDGTSVRAEIAYVVAGHEYTVRSGASSVGKPHFRLGDRVDVAYDPFDPGTSYVPADRSGVWSRRYFIAFSSFFIVLGAVILIIALVS